MCCLQAGIYSTFNFNIQKYTEKMLFFGIGQEENMKKVKLIILIVITVFIAYGESDINMKQLEESITKDYDQDGRYSSYEKALRRAQESIYMTLPEKRGYWYTILEKIKAEEAELYADEAARMKKK